MITNIPNATWWDPQLILHDRFFAAQIDGRPTLFVLHGDHSVSVALVNGPVIIEETPEQLLAALRELVA
jgi:hypothetical protein